MRRVWKYDTDRNGLPFVRTMPEGAELLTVDLQGDDLVFWALVDPDAAREDRTFVLVGTGHDVPADAEYRGTFPMIDGWLILHLFELPA